jgi:hypothetical protein
LALVCSSGLVCLYLGPALTMPLRAVLSKLCLITDLSGSDVSVFIVVDAVNFMFTCILVIPTSVSETTCF